jgi:hypothetical protein
MNQAIEAYNNAQASDRKPICAALAKEIQRNLSQAENKLWHGSPVWFLNDNPVVGYSVRKDNVQLLFWSGQSFEEPGLQMEGSFKAAEVRYTNLGEVNLDDLRRWLQKCQTIQWDYKNIVKRRGVLERLI